MQKLYWLDQIQPEDIDFVGEKAFNLSLLLQQGYPVLPGFVISAALIKEFIDENTPNSFIPNLQDLSLLLQSEDYDTLKTISQITHDTIVKAPIPQDWLHLLPDAAGKLKSESLIVRLSLLSPYQITGLLSFKICDSKTESLSLAIKSIIAELFDPKNLTFWHKNNLGIENLSLGILVQPIRDALASGVVEIKNDLMNIYSTWGLGFSIVRGEVEPDLYEVQLPTKILAGRHLGSKVIAYKLNPENPACHIEYNLVQGKKYQSLSLGDETLLSIINLVKDIREEWKLLQGLEWTIPLAKEGEKQDIFITTINLVKPDISSASLMEKDQLLIKGLGASLGSAIAPARVMINLDSQSQTEGQILVTHNITPEWINLIRQSQGIITETGGMTSHAAILAREFRLPAVVGAKNATHLINSGDTLCINGANGEIHRVSGFSESQLASQFPPFTNQFNYPIATKLLVNLSQVSSLNYVSNLPIDGIGLLRSELLLLELFLSNNLQDITGNKNQTVFKEKYTASLIKFASAFYPRPVFYRFLDLGEDVPLRFDKQMPKYRGTYNYCLQPELLDIQLEVLVGIKQQGYDNLILVLPFVRAVEEFKFCRRIIDNFYSITDLPIWIMAEVPSVLFLLPEYVKAGVQGITIGTNDLTWLLLGSDRQNLLEKLTVNHPAVLTAIKQLIQQANALEIPCSICGLAPVQYPDLIDKFIEWGVTSISVEVDAIVQTYNAIARAEQRLLLKQKGRVK